MANLRSILAPVPGDSMKPHADSASALEVSILEELANLVHGIASPFVCGGTLTPKVPVQLRFRDGIALGVKAANSVFDQEVELEPLLKRTTPAPFGKGKKTLFGREVRDARQIKAEGGTFSVENFDPEESGILEVVRQKLTPNDPNPLSAELYNLNVYCKGGHFKPHKDTPRGSNMIGTLVVCLPSLFSSGELVVSHRGVRKTFDWARQIGANSQGLPWAAFFGDVDHEIKPVYNGARVTLSYILRRGEGAVLASPMVGSHREHIHKSLLSALQNRGFFSRGAVLGFPCFHMYSHEAAFQKELEALTPASVLKLKGRDQEIAAAAMQEGLTVRLQPYLVESSCDEAWQLKRFVKPTEVRKLGARVDTDDLDAKLPVLNEGDCDLGDFGVTWVVPPPDYNNVVAASEDSKSAEPDAPMAQHLHTCEYSTTGYFGNEGTDTDFYEFGALQMEIPKWGDGVRKPPQKAESKETKAGAKSSRRSKR